MGGGKIDVDIYCCGEIQDVTGRGGNWEVLAAGADVLEVWGCLWQRVPTVLYKPEN